jgi:hypothetical protein
MAGWRAVAGARADPAAGAVELGGDDRAPGARRIHARAGRGEVVSLDPAPTLPATLEELPIVVDRFTWRPEEHERLVDASEQAFRRGEGRLELRLGNRPAVRPQRALGVR